MIYCLGIFQEDANRGKPNWEHLADDLHVLLTVEDTENRAKIKLARAVEEVKRLLVPVSFKFEYSCLSRIFKTDRHTSPFAPVKQLCVLSGGIINKK